jgi:hypothetical protein
MLPPAWRTVGNVRAKCATQRLFQHATYSLMAGAARNVAVFQGSTLVPECGVRVCRTRISGETLRQPPDEDAFAPQNVGSICSRPCSHFRRNVLTQMAASVLAARILIQCPPVAQRT